MKRLIDPGIPVIFVDQGNLYQLHFVFQDNECAVEIGVGALGVIIYRNGKREYLFRWLVSNGLEHVQSPFFYTSPNISFFFCLECDDKLNDDLMR